MKFGQQAEGVRERDAWAWKAVHLVLLVVFSFYAFRRNIGWLFPGGDGAYWIHTLVNQRLWSSFSLGFSWNPLQGLGDVDFPLNTWLVPGYALPALAFGTENATTQVFQITSHVIFAVELFVATLCLSRTLGIGWPATFCAGWSAPLLMLPYFGVPLLYPLLLLSPHVATVIADSMLAIAAVTKLGQRGSEARWIPARDVLLVGAIYGLLGHATLIAPAAIILFAPVTCLGFVGLLFGSERAIRIRQIAGLALVATLLAGSGFALFAIGILDFTVPRVFGNRLELVQMLQDWQFVSNWFYLPAIAGKKFVGLAVIGLGLAIASRDRRLRTFAAAVGSMTVMIFVIGACAVGTDRWRLPALVYYEMFLAPLYAMFATYGLFKVAGWIEVLLVKNRATSRVMHMANIAAWSLPIALVIPAIGFYAARHTLNLERVWGPMPPRLTPLISTLKSRIGLRPGDPFRGRVATLQLIDSQEQVGWMDLVNRNALRVTATGNDYIWSGLWPSQIPTLFKYSPLMSPAYFGATTRLAGYASDRQMRNVIVLRRANAHALALLGVKYVISDIELQSPFRLETSERTTEREVLYLYEVPKTNLGQFSPVELLTVRYFDDALDVLADQSFDSERKAVIFDALPDGYNAPLVAARRSELKVGRDGLEVAAQSDGMSMLVLPFEFSNCLSIEAGNGSLRQPRLMRVNAVQIGVLFDKEVKAKISYFTGPFKGSTCRLNDKRELIGLFRVAH